MQRSLSYITQKVLLAENKEYFLVSFFGEMSQRAAYELNRACGVLASPGCRRTRGNRLGLTPEISQN